jgi:exopolyphosphatase/guanosine-5'-triphosphate,3'-diphosphate pyrophosphatase
MAGNKTEIAAAVDIGTNSVKITVGRREADGRVTVLLDQTSITRLGKGVDKTGRLDDEAMHRTLTALASFGQDARNLAAQTIAAVGTSALRDAANGPAFVRQAAGDLGGTVEVIAGEREASLVYASARHDADLHLPADATLVTIDIGGGSTEIVIGRGDDITFRDSLQLGAVRVTERTLPTDPPTADERNAAVKMIDDALGHVPTPEGTVLVVASGGTAANLAAMEIMAAPRETKVTPDTLHGTRLTLAQVEARIDSLAALPLTERKKTPGLEPDRADVIIAGMLVQARALHRFGVETLVVSARGLRFGLLYELLGVQSR